MVKVAPYRAHTIDVFMKGSGPTTFHTKYFGWVTEWCFSFSLSDLKTWWSSDKKLLMGDWVGISGNDAYDFMFGEVNPYPAGGKNLPPSWVFWITPKPLQISTQTLVYLLLHQFDIAWQNLVDIGRTIFEKLTFLWGHFTPILTKTGSMSRNSPKIGF